MFGNEETNSTSTSSSYEKVVSSTGSGRKYFQGRDESSIVFGDDRSSAREVHVNATSTTSLVNEEWNSRPASGLATVREEEKKNVKVMRDHNQMSTQHVERPSSRVLGPPGGRTSIMIG